MLKRELIVLLVLGGVVMESAFARLHIGLIGPHVNLKGLLLVEGSPLSEVE